MRNVTLHGLRLCPLCMQFFHPVLTLQRWFWIYLLPWLTRMHANIWSFILANDRRVYCHDPMLYRTIRIDVFAINCMRACYSLLMVDEVRELDVAWLL